jgi:hypothetical protein
MYHTYRSRQKEHGQSIVELSISFTLIMSLLAGIVELGRALFIWQAMRDAAQEGAYFGSISPPGTLLTCDDHTPSPPPEICKRVWDNLKQVVADPSSKIKVTISYPPQPCEGSTIKVDVDYPNFNSTVSFLGKFLGGHPISIHASINDTVFSTVCP